MLTLKSLAFAAALVAGSTTSAHASSIGSVRLESGNGGQVLVAREQDVRAALEEIKRKSRLTWAELAGLFEVSRRTVHSWVNGAPVRAANASRVSRLLERVRELDGLQSYKVRAELLGNHANSVSGSLVPHEGESPILVSDNTPFVHQLKLGPAKTKIKRG